MGWSAPNVGAVHTYREWSLEATVARAARRRLLEEVEPGSVLPLGPLLAHATGGTSGSAEATMLLPDDRDAHSSSQEAGHVRVWLGPYFGQA